MYFIPFEFFLLLSFPRRKDYFILHMGGVMDSSSPDQGLTYVCIIEAYISFEEGCNGVAVNKNHYLILYIPIIFLLIICNFYIVFTFVLVYMPLFMCFFVHKCVVVQLSVSYGI